MNARAVACGAALGVLLTAWGCALRLPDTPTAEALLPGWDPTSVAAAAPGLVGWRAGAGADGALVALSPEGTATIVWQPTSAELSEAGISEIHAVTLDARGTGMVCVATIAGTKTPAEEAVIWYPSVGGVRKIALPESYGAVSGACFVEDTPLVLAYRAAAGEFATTLGAIDSSGAWRDVEITGTLPAFQFVERIIGIPGTTTVAVVLKTPGGTGDRDDEALVLAEFDGESLAAYTPPFTDDYLPGCSALWEAEGVIYPRPRTGAAGTELVRVEWTGERWDERVVATGANLASGIETGIVAAADSEGAYWVRTSSSGPTSGEGLMRLDAETGAASPASADMTDIDWFQWIAGY